ncbi:MAG: valine--tRNA ligase [Candidatus Omnitrophota bacterium]
MELAKQYSHKETEDKIYRFWMEKGYFSAKADTKKQPFCIVIPPPNITGILHMGHALNNTIQDVLIRYNRMAGNESLWMPGTDHAGIATQNVVEKKLAKEGSQKEDIGREAFLEKLWQWRDEYGSTIIEQLKKLGSSCDWNRTRFTMDTSYSDAVTEVFVSLWEKKLIYQGNYIINWCPRCKTALSDEEAPRQETQGLLYYIKYPVSDKNSDDYIIVATTRPETMLGDTAVAVHPDDKRYEAFWDKRVFLPLMERQIPVVKDEVVDPSFGSGAVKVTPAHDLNDFEIGKRHNLPSILVMNPDGTMNQNAGDFACMDRFEARDAIVESLKQLKLLLRIEPHRHAVGYCYRCDTIIEPYFSKQWFVRMKSLAQPAIDAVKKGEIKFYPQRWTKVYLNWMENIRDWCISRQIWWGHRIPVYYCNDCDTPVASKTKPAKCDKCSSANIRQDDDVLDTWFSSWLWPFATFGWPAKDKLTDAELKYFYPTSVLVTAPEIIFFWVARMIMAGFEFIGKKPFSHVYIHGTVRDASGKKMSKSLGNIIDPLDVIDKFGADALRFSLMLLASGGSDIYLSDENFLVGRNFANKIWNAARFILTKIEQEGISLDTLELTDLSGPDQWLIKNLNDTISAVGDSLKAYRINDATKKAYEFFWHTFCDWYIEMTKSEFSHATARVLIHTLVTALKLLHPMMPFITEELFGLIKKEFSCLDEESLITAAWPKQSPARLDESNVSFVESMVVFISAIRNLKVEIGIAATDKLAAAVKIAQDKKETFSAYLPLIRRMASLNDITFSDKLGRKLFKNDFIELDFILDKINEANYVSAIEKKINKFSDLLAKSSGKISSKKFIDNAPPEIIEKEKENFQDLNRRIQRLREISEAFK